MLDFNSIYRKIYTQNTFQQVFLTQVLDSQETIPVCFYRQNNA